MGVQVIATSSYLPTSVITNDDWAKRVDTSDEWIVKRTGIKTRYWAKEQTTSELATIAAKRLVEKSNISPESIEFIIVAISAASFNVLYLPKLILMVPSAYSLGT